MAVLHIVLTNNTVENNGMSKFWFQFDSIAQEAKYAPALE